MRWWSVKAKSFRSQDDNARHEKPFTDVVELLVPKMFIFWYISAIRPTDPLPLLNLSTHHDG